MGRRVGVSYAKRHLSALLVEIETTGNAVTITRRGKPVAHMMSASSRRVGSGKIAGPETAGRMRAIREAAERRGVPALDVQQFIREIRDED